MLQPACYDSTVAAEVLLERIVADPKVLAGKPLVRGTRISVELVLDLLARGYSKEDVLAQYDHLTVEDVHACLAYAREVIHAERVYPATP